MKTINDFNFKNKKALIRVDFNVPLNDDFEVTDSSRIEAARPTIIKVLEDGGSCVLMSHLGRPKGKEEKYSLQNIKSKVREVLGVQVHFVDDCIGDKSTEAVAKLQSGEILLLENLRFYKEEIRGNRDFAKKLSKLGDIYVNDAFGMAHRAHASTAIIADFFPSKKYFGMLLASEIVSIGKVLNNSVKPVTAIIGGAKVSSKITILLNILDKIDNLIICGGMAFTFVKALGGSIGNSLIEEDKLVEANTIFEKAKLKKVTIHLPIDTVVADSLSENAITRIEDTNSISEGWMGLDVGPASNDSFTKVITQSKTILWNGPAGVFEIPIFAQGTMAIGNAIVKATKNGAFSLVGGGDTVAALKKFGLTDEISHVSTGGGALLEMLEGKTLPGIKAIEG